MKTLLKKIFMIILAAVFLYNISAEAQVANPQSKFREHKLRNSPLLRIRQSQNDPGQRLGIKVNPYWEDINAPHLYNSFIPQILVPSPGTIWARVKYDSLPYDPNQFLRSADGGNTWRLDSVDAPNGYALGTLSPIDANTCYASMYNALTFMGGGVFKTTDGGDTWKQINPGKLFSENSFPDIVYFFDAQHGLAVGDNDGTDISKLEIYTTSDAGKTWQRVPDKNIPPTTGYAYGNNFNSYAVFQNRFWLMAGDSDGNTYFYRSDDFGQHWQQFPYTLGTAIYGFAFADKQNGLGVYFDDVPHEIETHDGGKTWASKSFTGYPMGVFITVIPSTHTFISTIGHGVTPVGGSSYSNDFGATWNLIDSSSNFNPLAVAFFSPLIGWSGRAESSDPNGGMYKWKYHFSLDNDAAVATDDEISISKNSTTGLSVFPNPVTSVVNVSFFILQTQKVSVAIYDMNGSLIKTLANEQMQQGIHQLSWNARSENVIAGNYFLKLQMGIHIETKKITLIR
jgi:photosystem II stability/assembly factor-like uncharacterized protein